MINNDIYIVLQDFPGGATKIICHVQANEPDLITNNPFTIFRQEVYVESMNIDEFNVKQLIVKGIIDGFQKILECMKRLNSQITLMSKDK